MLTLFYTMKYFKHDLEARNDDKIFELIEAHGMQGYGIWWVLLEELYKAEEQGFQIEATDTWFKRLSRQLNLTDWRTLIRTLDTMAEQGLIDSQLWAEHIIFAPGMAKRADRYIQVKQAAAERKRRQRARDKQALSHVTPTGQPPSHSTVTTNTDPDPDPDPDPDHPSCSYPDLDPGGGEKENALPHEPKTESTSAQPSPDLDPPSCAAPPRMVDRQAAQFAPKPWRDVMGKTSREFQEFVGKAITFGDSSEEMHPRTKGLAHINKLDRSGDPYDRERIEAYWEDYQDTLARPAATERKELSLNEIQRRIQSEMGGIA